jgi:hypothetical protein
MYARHLVKSVLLCQVPSHAAVFINEPRLSEFKQFVVSRGIQAEMSGGALICNNIIAVRRVSRGAFLHSTLGPLFIIIKIIITFFFLDDEVDKNR